MSDSLRKVFVARLPEDIKEDEIHFIFKTYGRVEEVVLLDKSKSRAGQRCGFVIYETSDAAHSAVQVLDSVYRFREESPEAIHVSIAKPRGSGKGDGKDRDRGGASDLDRGGDRNSDRGGSRGDGYGKGGQSRGQGNRHDDRFDDRYDDRRVDDRRLDDRRLDDRRLDDRRLDDRRLDDRRFDDRRFDDRRDDRYVDRRDDIRDDRRGDRAGGSLGSRDRGYDRGPPGGKDRMYDRGHDGGKGGNHARDRDQAGGGSGGRRGGESGGGGAAGTKLYVGNLPSDIVKEDLEQVFAHYGRLEDVHVMTGRSKSGQAAAFVRYSNPREASDCIAAMAQGYEIRPGEGEIMVKLADGASGKGEKGRDGGRSKPY
mmetsp:Transcript_52217/g.93670  ORF Transcript_52217/g.93670 Transcript_52217/m.93670 type:complete len:370 (-) Transcript_52217:57-1166(-)